MSAPLAHEGSCILAMLSFGMQVKNATHQVCREVHQEWSEAVLALVDGQGLQQVCRQIHPPAQLQDIKVA